MMTRLKDLYLASPLRLLTHFLLIILVVAWTFPTLGLFVSSFRSADEISSTGWWSSLSSSSQNKRVRLGEANLQELIDGKYVISGELLSNKSTKVINFGDSLT